jgi:putative heme transporter
VALVAVGPVKALIMFGVVVGVQQLEAHVLQPFLMGRFVSVHPLGVIIAIAAGILLAGIPGALVAVPFAAAANAVVQHLASETAVGEDPESALESDYQDTGQHVATDADTGDAEDGAVGDTQEAGVADQFDSDRTDDPDSGGDNG